MRGILVATMMLGAVQCAEAADMPDYLRGSFTDAPVARVNWQGYYIGGQGSYGSSNMNFAGANDKLATGLMAYSPVQSLANVPELGKASDQKAGIGAFIGYNWQWEDAVFGLDASYIHGDFHGGASPVPFRYSNGFQVLTNASSVASVDMKDYGSLRARAGYAVGNFLPYLTGGIALGRADIDRTVSLRGNFDPLVTTRSNQADHLIYGYSFGAGVDIMLVAGLFLRAEYEYQRFATPVDVNINTVRGGLGYKF